MKNPVIPTITGFFLILQCHFVELEGLEQRKLIN